MSRNGLSASDTLRIAKADTLAAFKRRNPDTADMGKKGASANVLLLREVGTYYTDCGCENYEKLCDLSSSWFSFDTKSNAELYLSEVYNMTVNFTNTPYGYFTGLALFVLFPPVCNAKTYEVSVTNQQGNPIDIVQYNLGFFPSNQSTELGVIVVYFPTLFMTTQINSVFIVSNKSKQSSQNATTYTSAFPYC